MQFNVKCMLNITATTVAVSVRMQTLFSRHSESRNTVNNFSPSQLKALYQLFSVKAVTGSEDKAEY